MMGNDDDIEKFLKSLAKSELEDMSSPEIDKTLALARRQTHYQEGVGFLYALIWVVFAGLGLHIFRSVHSLRQRGHHSVYVNKNDLNNN
jgi:hypothetical protein